MAFQLSDPVGIARSPAQLAYEKILPEISAIPDRELLTINGDAEVIAGAVLCRLPRLLALDAELRQQGRGIGAEPLERLGDYALGLSHAEALYRSAQAPPPRVLVRTKQLEKMRRRFLADAASLAQHELLEQ